MTPDPAPSNPLVGKPRPKGLNSGVLFWALHIAGWGGFFLVGYLSAIANGKPCEIWKLLFAVAATGFFGTLGLRYLLRACRDLPPLRVTMLMIAPVLVVAAAMGLTFIGGLGMGWCDVCQPMSRVNYVAYVFNQLNVVVGWTSLYLVITNWRKLQLQTQAALAATAMAHQAQLKMLRYQLNPHFLFNTLNAISTLVLDRDNATANRMVQGLSAFLRHSLDADPMQRVTLKQEIDAIGLYLEIEKTRFAERLRVSIDVEPACWSALMPSLLLQPLVENAIKYAVAKRVEGGTLGLQASLAGDRLRLSVTDDGPGWPALKEGGVLPDQGPQGTRVGLANTRERLRVLYGERQSFEARNRDEGGFMVTMTLPFEIRGAPRE
ncbi:sensor histidine kinase [Luteimonas gilva]|uniref:Sensor histidine kinase n=1 Tax=Luteimonas gilva TaxID=2572684 RepID=A0A4U5JVA8_9GAMM|nr:histidine kinase [Luteimonas gilva]TKR33852.1 sensor histidine kinase [Luteimonas gilva]